MQGFVPDFFGCVRRDARLCRMTELIQRECFSAMTDCICISLRSEETEEIDCLEETALVFLECFCFLGKLTVALGGSFSLPSWRESRGNGEREGQGFSVRERIAEHRRSLFAHCQRVARWTDDGVARAAFSFLCEKIQEDRTDFQTKNE